MSDELIASLKQQLERMDRDYRKVEGESASRKDRLRELNRKLEALTKERDGAIKERDAFKARAESDPDRSAEEIDKLRGEIRQYRHRDGMGQLAYSSEIGINRSVPVDRLMALIGYQPQADEFDAKQAKKLLVALKESDPYLFAPAEGSGQHQAPGLGGAALNPAVAGLGSALGRGSTPNPAGGPGELTEEHMRDPVYMSDYNRRMRTGK